MYSKYKQAYEDLVSSFNTEMLEGEKMVREYKQFSTRMTENIKCILQRLFKFIQNNYEDICKKTNILLVEEAPLLKYCNNGSSPNVKEALECIRTIDNKPYNTLFEDGVDISRDKDGISLDETNKLCDTIFANSVPVEESDDSDEEEL
jgi:hypothetical protein